MKIILFLKYSSSTEVEQVENQYEDIYFWHYNRLL